MIPHTLVLEPRLRVYKIYNGYWSFGRPTVEELRLDLGSRLDRAERRYELAWSIVWAGTSSSSCPWCAGSIARSATS